MEEVKATIETQLLLNDLINKVNKTEIQIQNFENNPSGNVVEDLANLQNEYEILNETQNLINTIKLRFQNKVKAIEKAKEQEQAEIEKRKIEAQLKFEKELKAKDELNNA